MRFILVGTSRQRHEIRDRLELPAFDIVGEFDTLADARSSGITADAILLPPPASASGDDAEMPERLTVREIDVLELVAEGLANKAIAERLGISDQTVKFHLASIMGKLGASNRTDAVRRAVRGGLVTL
jgi:DNA-binding NarL/FixJ family response regulator